MTPYSIIFFERFQISSTLCELPDIGITENCFLYFWIGAVGLLFQDKNKTQRDPIYKSALFEERGEIVSKGRRQSLVLLTWTQSDEVLQRVWIYILSLSVFFNSLKLEQ